MTIIAKPATTSKKKHLSKSDILSAVADAVGEDVSKRHVKAVVESLVAVGHNELKKNGTFVLHGLAKFTVVKKPARPAREGINPFTKEKQTFAAKPASKAVRARVVRPSRTRSPDGESVSDARGPGQVPRPWLARPGRVRSPPCAAPRWPGVAVHGSTIGGRPCKARR